MKRFRNPSLFILLIMLLSCKNSQDENVTLFGNTEENSQKPTTQVDGEQQTPIFTPSELPYPFSRAVQVGNILYLSGEIGVADDGVSVVEGGIVPETHRIFERIEATLALHRLGLEDVFKCTVMLADMSEWPKFNEVYASYFKTGRFPTRSAMGVNGLAIGARVEMECWAYIPLSK